MNSHKPVSLHLSDEDVINEMQLISKLPDKFTTGIFTKYSQGINSLLALSLKHCVDDEDKVEVEQLRRIIQMCPIEEKFIRTKSKIWKSRQHILSKNADYFLNRDYSDLIKADENKAFIESLLEIVKARYNTLSLADQELYWKKSAFLLNCVAQFEKAMSQIQQ